MRVHVRILRFATLACSDPLVRNTHPPLATQLDRARDRAFPERTRDRPIRRRRRGHILTVYQLDETIVTYTAPLRPRWRCRFAVPPCRILT
eukprot:7694457-Pyramimonas_sp.AAC.1